VRSTWKSDVTTNSEKIVIISTRVSCEQHRRTKQVALFTLYFSIFTFWWFQVEQSHWLMAINFVMI